MRSKLLLSLSSLSLALVAAITMGCGDETGLAIQKRSDVVKAGMGAPEAVQPEGEETPYPLGKPSALRGRPIFTANCASCHGTYFTAVEKKGMQEDLGKPEGKREVLPALLKEGRDANNPNFKPRNGPDFYSRDWRFQRRPGDLYNLIAFGSDKLDAKGKPAGRLHPGPDGSMGKGWMEHLRADRGNLMVAAADPMPVWDVVYYAWSRSIAGAGENRYKEVWDTFTQNCSVCHGGQGKGDGPLSHTLNPLPFNFQNRKALAETTDEFLFWRISEGGQFRNIPQSVLHTMSPRALGLYVHQWSAMPSWRGVLTEEQRWMAVDGVRSKTYEHE